MTDSRITRDYDLNIMNEEGDGDSKTWVIEIYEFRVEVDKDNPENYQEVAYSRKQEDGVIRLSEEEATMLSLGSSDGYSEEEYFWVDTDNFFMFYKNIPERLADILSKLPEYEMDLVYV